MKCSKNTSFLPIYACLSLSLSPMNTNNNNHTGTNTSSPFYDGSWTMYDNMTKHDGLRTATKSSNFVSSIRRTVNGVLKVRFRYDTDQSGGLLDSEAGLNSLDQFYDFARFDPSIYDLSERSMYWSADFARTVHPRKYLIDAENFMWCPLSKNCTISKATSASKTSPNAEECAELAKEDLSMLGSDPNYGCYFEWVFNNLGENAYMHRPLSWSFLEFTQRRNKCGNIQFPVRHLLRILYEVEKKLLHHKVPPPERCPS